MTFDNFSVPGPENPIARRELTGVLLTIKNFVRDFKNESRPGLLLIGEPGTGKTHLAIAALRQIVDKGFEGDGAVHDGANLAVNIGRRAAGFADVSGIGGDAVNDAPAPGFADLFNVSGVEEYFHDEFSELSFSCFFLFEI